MGCSRWCSWSSTRRSAACAATQVPRGTSSARRLHARPSSAGDRPFRSAGPRRRKAAWLRCVRGGRQPLARPGDRPSRCDVHGLISARGARSRRSAVPAPGTSAGLRHPAGPGSAPSRCDRTTTRARRLPNTRGSRCPRSRHQHPTPPLIPAFPKPLRVHELRHVSWFRFSQSGGCRSATPERPERDRVAQRLRRRDRVLP